MIVECESCKTRFNVETDRIKDDGSKVRCSKCRHVFMIYKPSAEEAAGVPPVSPDAAWLEHGPAEETFVERDIDPGQPEETAGFQDEIFDEAADETEAVDFDAIESISENDVPVGAIDVENIQSLGADFCPDDEGESEDEDEIEETAVSVPSARRLKILVIGGQSYPMSSDLKVASFEMVYRDAIRMICEGAGAPSLASIEFGKGWGALSATIRNNGWANGVDVLTVSNCYMSRAEILMELRLLADLVIEAN